MQGASPRIRHISFRSVTLGHTPHFYQISPADAHEGQPRTCQLGHRPDQGRYTRASLEDRSTYSQICEGQPRKIDSAQIIHTGAYPHFQFIRQLPSREGTCQSDHRAYHSTVRCIRASLTRLPIRVPDRSRNIQTRGPASGAYT